MLIETEDLIKLLKDHILNSEFKYDGKSVRFKYKTSNKEETEKILKSSGAAFSFPNDNEVVIDINQEFQGGHYIFLNKSDFIERFSSQIDFENATLLIIGNNEPSIIKEKGEIFSKEKSIFFAKLNFDLILKFLKSEPDFSSYNPESDDQFVLSSPDSNSPLKVIGYNPIDKRISTIDFDLGVLFSTLKENFKKSGYKQIFKERILKSLQGIDTEDVYFRLLQSLKLLLNDSELDYQIFINKFAFDKISKKFKEERNKYFENLEKNIDSVSKQVASLPLTFSASAFASYQVKDKPTILLMILIAFIFYTVIALYSLIFLSWYNVSQIKRDLNHEKEEIRKYGDELYQPFKADIKQVESKIKRLKWLIGITVFIFIAILILFVLFILAQNSGVSIKPQLIKSI